MTQSTVPSDAGDAPMCSSASSPPIHYDLFVSYAEAEGAWVEGYLLDALGAAGVCVHSEAAFRLGVPRLLEFERAVRSSRRTLLVLSPAYLAEGFGQFTDLLAQSYGLETATWPVIPLLLRPVELPPRLGMLERLDATDPAGWPAVVARLCAELQRPVPGPPPRPACPYPGMVPFGEADSARFFGRDREVESLVQQLRLHPFLTVIGPSGSGKSSLVFAGLVPALRASGLFGPGEWLVRTARPGRTPLAALREAAGDVVNLQLPTPCSQPPSRGRPVSNLQPPASNLLLVVDQLEELFTRAREEERGPFQQALLGLAGLARCYVVLTVRADFYSDLMVSPLWPQVRAHRAEVLPLDDAGLRQAIVRPAEDAGVFVETALVERLVADAAGEPGILPFVQETLVLLWEKVERRYLPLRAYDALILSARSYRELGDVRLTGLQVAMADRAEAALGALNAQEQAIARRVFLRLVQFGEGRADTRRQQPVANLRAAGDDPATFDGTLEHLAHCRLLTLSGEEGGAGPEPGLGPAGGQSRTDGRRVDIAHEALIEGWPTLRGWLGERREAEQARRRLEAKVVEWERLGRGSGGLLDEMELLEAERWLESPDAADLGYGEALPALVMDSRNALAEQQAQQRRAARFRLGALGAIAALVVAIFAAVAIGQGRLAQQERRAVETAQAYAAREQQAAETAQAYAREQERLAGAEAAARAEAEQQARRALSGQLAAQADSVLEEYPQRSLLLALEALNVTTRASEPRVPAAEQVLRDALAYCGGRPLAGHEKSVSAIALSPDGRWLVTGSGDGTARLWDMASPDPAATSIVLRGHESWISALAISPDGHWLVTGSGDWTARLWDLTAADPAATSIVLPGHEEPIESIAISPDNRWLVTGSYYGTARLWELDAPDPAATAVGLPGSGCSTYRVAISSDSRWLVMPGAGAGDTAACLWDLAAPDPAAALVLLRGSTGQTFAIAISPDGRWLVTGSEDGTSRLWDLAAPEPGGAFTTLDGQGHRISTAVFSPDSHWLVTGSDDATVAFSPRAYLWDVTSADPSAAPVALNSGGSLISAVAFSPDGRWLAAGSEDHTVRLWVVDLLKFETPTSEPFITWRGHEGGINTIAISADSYWLVSGSWDGTARLWALAAPDVAATSIVLRGHESLFPPLNAISHILISPDSRWLVTSGMHDTTPRLWDVSSLLYTPLTVEDLPASPTVLRGHWDGVSAVAISPDTHWLVTGSGGGGARLWDLSAPEPAAASTMLYGHWYRVSAVAISPDGHWLVTGSDDATAHLWDLAALDPSAAPIILAGHESWISAVAFSPDNRWLVTGSGDRTARLWDLSAPDPAAASVVLRGHEDGVHAIAISPDGHWLATGSVDGTARLWDLAAPDPSAAPIVLAGHESWISAVAFSPDSHWLATGSADATARLWDLTAPDPAAAPVVLRGDRFFVSAVAFSPDNRWLVTGSDEDATTRLWDLTAPDLAATSIALHGHENASAESGPGVQVALSRDGRWLVTAGEEGTARLWDLAAPDPSATSIVLRGHQGIISAVAISPNGHWLVTGGLDDTARVWNLRLDELVGLACRTTGRNLTRAEWEQYFPGEDHRATCPQWPLEGAEE